MRRILIGGAGMTLAALGGCAPRQPVPAAPAAAPLPELPVAAREPAPLSRGAAPSSDPLASVPAGNPVTLSARNVDVRALLLALAEQAGVSLVIDPTVDARTTVSFTGVPAREALRAVLDAAGLRVAGAAPSSPVGPTVFYLLPVDIEQASAELIQVRFGVSAEVARLIVENRVP